MSYYPDFARLLTQLLQERDRTPTWLARRLSISPRTINRWLNHDGRPGDSATVAQIADLLNASGQTQALLVAAGYGYQSVEANEEESPPASCTTEATHGEQTDSNPEGDFVPPFLVPALPPQGMIGRDDLLREIVGMLAMDSGAVVEHSAIALQGMGGIGKTTLAIALAHMDAMRQLFPDGVLWTSIGPAPVLRNLLEGWDQAVGVSLVAERDEAACRARLRTLLHIRRMLLVVDDLWETSHGEYFAVAGPNCGTVLTTRETPIAHALATRERTMRLDLLSPQAALQLLSQLTPDAIAADRANAQRLCARLEYLPLALTLAGRLLANESDVPSRMQRLVAELIEEREARLQLIQQEGRLGHSENQPVSLHAILGMSVERLSPDDQQRFAMLSVFGGEPLTWELAAARYVWDCTVEEAEATISTLIERWLVTSRQHEYWMHALLADYASEMLEAIG